MFKCDKCGLCCKKLNLSPLYRNLDRGDGVCIHLNGNLCRIYETRPLICRVDECYEAFFKEKMSLEEFYRLNEEMCNILKKEKEF